VVIAIMAVLIAILLPALSQAKEQARSIKCRTNLYGFGAGLAMYLDDNNGCFPPAYSWLYKTALYDANYRNRNIDEYKGEGIQTVYDKSRNYCRWHDNSVSLDNIPQYAGVLWPYISERDIGLCPTFDKLAQTGLGEIHTGHIPGLPIDPQYTYSMNGHLGSSWMGVAQKIGSVEKNPASVFSFTEENIMFNIYSRSKIVTIPQWNIPFGKLDFYKYPPNGKLPSWDEILITNLATPVEDRFVYIMPGLNVTLSRVWPYKPGDYSGAFATYHNPPADDIQINEVNLEAYATYDDARIYPKWGLCRGSGNAVFLDQHVESMPYNVDTHDFAWPLRGKFDHPQYLPKFYWQK